MLDHTYAVIMAGGGGTRLWPLSRKARPKQMLSLFDERSLFQSAVERLNGLLPEDRIYVVTVAEQAAGLQAQCPAIPKENFLIEPQPRGTASVVGLAAVALLERDPQAVMAVLAADHIIKDEDRFRRLLTAAVEVARQDYLVTLGVEPTFPSTGFGYIQLGQPLGEFGGQAAYTVRRFKEKPDEAGARAMLAGGDHAWNSGMFVWQASRIWTEFERQMPALVEALQSIRSAWHTPQRQAEIQRLWPGLKNETIDYGVMEHAERVAVIPAAGLGWSDVGSWDALFEVMEPDEQHNIVSGAEHLGLDSSGSLIFASPPGRLIVTIGVQDLVVVDTGDVLLVCRKDQAQRVRQVVDQLKQSGTKYL